MNFHELCPTCLRPASLRKAAEIDVQSRQAEADRLNAFVASMEAAVCGAIGVDPVAYRVAELEAENKSLRDRFSDADTERNVAQAELKSAFARVAELEARCKRLEDAAHEVYLDSIASDHPWSANEARNMHALRDVLEAKP